MVFGHVSGAPVHGVWFRFRGVRYMAFGFGFGRRSCDTRIIPLIACKVYLHEKKRELIKVKPFGTWSEWLWK